MSLIQLLLWLLTGTAFALLCWKGRAAERLTTLAILIVILVPMFFQGSEMGNIRWVVALSSAGLALFLVIMGLIVDRWWLLAAAGIQLTAVSTYVLAYFQPDILIWSGVALRRILWLELMAACLFGVWEALQIKRYRLEEAHRGKHFSA